MVFSLPLAVRHTVYRFTRGLVAHIETPFRCRGAIPFGQAISAKAGQIHDIDILNIGSFAEVRDEATKYRGLQLDFTGLVHDAATLLARPPAVELGVTHPNQLATFTKALQRQHARNSRERPQLTLNFEARTDEILEPRR